jgi:hypothetical protein
VASVAEVPTTFSELLAGYGTVKIADGMAVESVFALLKLRSENGRPSWSVRSGGVKLTSEELLGTLEGLTTSIRAKLTRGWRGEGGQPSSGSPEPTPFSDLLAGLETLGIVDEHLIESVFAVIKARATGGVPVWYVRSAEMKLSSEELLGALEGYAASVRQDVAGSWRW